MITSREFFLRPLLPLENLIGRLPYTMTGKDRKIHRPSCGMDLIPK